MIWNSIKSFIKKLTGIRRIVEGRDRYMQLYTDLLSDKNKLEMQRLELQGVIERREQELGGIRDEDWVLIEEVEQLRDRVSCLQEETRNCKTHIAKLRSENTQQSDTLSKLQLDWEGRRNVSVRFLYLPEAGNLIG